MSFGTSPLPVRHQHMDFYEALKQINDGQLITKLEWNDPGTYGFLKNGLLMMHFSAASTHECGDGDKCTSDHAWLLRDADIAGEDYVIAEPVKAS